MTAHATLPPQSTGTTRYEEYSAKQLADSEFARRAAEEAAKKAIWMALIDARHAARLTQAQVAERLVVSQAQVARIERRGYESHTRAPLRR